MRGGHHDPTTQRRNGHTSTLNIFIQMVWPQNVLLTTKKLGGKRNLAGGPKEVIERQQT